MIVRLPQQHIQEQAYDVSYTSSGCVFDDKASPPNEWTAVTRISGYSYLVFRIIFPQGKDEQKIPLTEETLLDWNNNIQDIFRLVVRQNLAESLFEITISDVAGVRKENVHPFNYIKLGQNSNDSWEKFDISKSYKSFKYVYNYDNFPKVFSDPITALEFPWRLILSPKLPDQDRFKWNWEFSKTPVVTNNEITEAELWYASLTIKEDSEYLKKLTNKKKGNKERG